MNARNLAFKKWLDNNVTQPIAAVSPLPQGASFRRYYRIYCGKETYVAMNAPPDQEDPLPFIVAANAFTQIGLRVPHIYAADLEQGFLLLSDFGDRLYLKELNERTADTLYQIAINALISLHQCTQFNGGRPSRFTDTLQMQELQLYKTWVLQRHLQLDLTPAIETMLQDSFEFIVQECMRQPTVCLHRDYHSLNLMQLSNNRVGILDFQDTVLGPITYDVVSLLKDCYLEWPYERILTWLKYFYCQARYHKLLPTISFMQFTQWFNLMGIQRHLKANFIFIRKLYRDHDPQYLPHIPRIIHYLQQALIYFNELTEFHHYFENTILPAWRAKQPLLKV